jgi:hypothetical protein
VVAILFTFRLLTRIGQNPLHPEQYALVLLGTIPLLFGAHGEGPCWGLAGVTVSVLFLLKINLGAFAGMALFSLLVLNASHRQRSWLVPTTATLLFIGPLLLMRQHLRVSGYLPFCIGLSFCILAMFLVCACCTKVSAGLVKARQWLSAAGGVLFGSVIVFALLYWHGAPPLPALRGIIARGLRFAKTIRHPPPEDWLFPLLGFFGFGLALLSLFVLRKAPVPRQHAKWYRAAGVTLLLALLILLGTGLRHKALVVCLPFLWILPAAIRATPSATAGSVSPAVVTVSLLCILLPLAAFPMFASHLMLAQYFAVVLAGLFCGALAQSILVPFRVRYTQYALRLIRVAAPVLLLALLLLANWRYYQRWDRKTPLALTGTASIRLPPDQVKAYRFLVEETGARGDALLTAGSLHSLGLWAPDHIKRRYKAWGLHRLGPEEEAAILRGLQQSQKPLVLLRGAPDVVLRRLAGQAQLHDLAHYIKTSFQPTLTVRFNDHGSPRSYTLLERRGTSDGEPAGTSSD